MVKQLSPLISSRALLLLRTRKNSTRRWRGRRLRKELCSKMTNLWTGGRRNRSESSRRTKNKFLRNLRPNLSFKLSWTKLQKEMIWRSRAVRPPQSSHRRRRHPRRFRAAEKCQHLKKKPQESPKIKWKRNYSQMIKSPRNRSKRSWRWWSPSSRRTSHR